MFKLYRSHSSAKNRRNYVDDALENLEGETAQLKESLELLRQEHATAEKRIQTLEEDNTQLRKILDQVRDNGSNRVAASCLINDTLGLICQSWFERSQWIWWKKLVDSQLPLRYT